MRARRLSPEAAAVFTHVPELDRERARVVVVPVLTPGVVGDDARAVDPRAPRPRAGRRASSRTSSCTCSSGASWASCGSSRRYFGEYLRLPRRRAAPLARVRGDLPRGGGPRPQRRRPSEPPLWYGRSFLPSHFLRGPSRARRSRCSSHRFRPARNHRRMLPPASFVERARARTGTIPASASARSSLAALVAGLAWYQLGVSGTAGAGATAPTTATTSASGGAPDTRRPDWHDRRLDGGLGHGWPARRAGRRRGRAPGRRPHPCRRAGHRRGRGRGRRAARRGPGPAEPRGQGRRRPAHRGRARRRAGPGRSRRRRGDRVPGPTARRPARSTSTPRRESQLEELPGIGPSLAGAIIAEREKRGGFKSVGELQDVRGIGELRFADIKDLVSV